jgi:hypothetical protein
MFRRFIHRLRHPASSEPATGVADDPNELAQAIHALDRRLTELRRELEEEARERLREVRAPGMPGY